MNDKILDIANIMNEREKFDILDIPIIEKFEFQKNSNKNIIFVARKDNLIEQFVFDSFLSNDISFEERVNEIVLETKKHMKDQDLKNSNDNLIFYKKINGLFEYHIYIQNYIKESKKGDILVKQLNVYFMEPNTRAFYQLSLSVGPLLLITANHEELLDGLETLIIGILKDIRYKNI